ncbi:MAG: cytochrome b [Gammaproteobacteria bacterium]
MSGPDRQYTALARCFHWVIAGLILYQIPLAYYMIALPLSPDKLGSYALHKSIGISIFAISTARLAWRWLRPPPPLPGNVGPATRRAGALTHGLLYCLTFALPLVGWLSSSAANFPVSLFGWFTLPDLVSPDSELHERLEQAHQTLAYILFATLSLHAGAALYHHFILRDGVLRAMLPFTGKRS